MITHRQLDADRWQRRERDREEIQRRLRNTLASRLEKGARVWVYGSVAKPGRFHENSDIDVAMEDPQCVVNLAELQNAISEATQREADVTRMEELRIADRIRRKGELWIV